MGRSAAQNGTRVLFSHHLLSIDSVSNADLDPTPMGNVTLSALVMFELSFQGRSDVVDIVSQNEICYKVTSKKCMETAWVRG